MKKLKIIILTLLFSITISKSQPTSPAGFEYVPCQTDCDELVPWSDVQVFEIEEENLCRAINVFYTWRIACGSQQINIIRYEVGRILKDGDALQPYFDEESYFKRALSCLFYLLPNFEPQENGDCGENWQVFNRTCWKKQWYSYHDSKGNIINICYPVPCDNSTECCKQSFTVCKESVGYFVKRTDNFITVPLCIDETEPNGTLSICKENCNWLPSVQEFYPNKNIINIKPITEIEPSDIHKFDFETKVYMNNNIFNIQLDTKGIQDLTIELFDINGREIESQRIKVNDGFNLFSFPIELKNQAIIFNIKKDNTILEAGKLIL